MTSEAWRYQLRAEGIERRPPPPDRGYIEQPGEASQPKSSLLIPLSVLKDEEEKAIMAELLEEERAAKQVREEDERASAGRPPLPPPPEPSAPRRRIVTRGDLRPERQPLRAALADFVTTERPAPENETRIMPHAKRDEPDHIDQQIKALLAKHEAAQRTAEPEPPPSPPQEHPTLLSRPQPPEPKPEAELPEDEWEDFREREAATQTTSLPPGQCHVGVDGRRFFTREFRAKVVTEFLRRRAQGETISLEAFGKTYGIHQTVMSRWVAKARRPSFANEPHPEESADMPTSAGGLQANGKRARRAFTDHEKLDILDKIDELLKGGTTLKDACAELDVYDSQIRSWQEARKNKTLRRPSGRRPAPREAAHNPKAPGPRSAVVYSPPLESAERDVGTVMAELQAAKERVKQLKAELMELL